MQNPQHITEHHHYQNQGYSPSKPTWSCIIRSHLSKGLLREALHTYNQIRYRGLCILGLVPLVLKACNSLSMLNYGKSLHGEAIKNGVDMDVIIGTSLLGMYSNCGCVFDSYKLFDEMPARNVVTWNAMINGFIKNGVMESAFVLFDKMPARTAVSWNQMIYGLARGGDLFSARCVFDQVPAEKKNVVTWTVMIDGYVNRGDMMAARLLFEEMPQRNFFVWSSMVSGYCKIGDVKEAKAIFDQALRRNLVIWNALICGYVQNWCCEEALESFRKMQEEGFDPDEFTVVGVLSACAELGLLDVGKDVHQMIYDKGIKLNEFVMSALVDMYAKCGDLDSAKLIFMKIKNKNSACWNAMISGFATHGKSKEALQLFRRMEEESNEKPDEITFLSVLSACAHGGFVDEGLTVFARMVTQGFAASIRHYGCLVDLLGRAGRLQDAYHLIKTMPMKPNDTVWGALLGACRIHLNTNMAEQVLEGVGMVGFAMDSENYILLSNVYAAADSWEKAESMRMFLVNKRHKKTPGCSSVLSVGTEKQFEMPML